MDLVSVLRKHSVSNPADDHACSGVYHTLDREERLHPANHDEHEPDHPVVPVCDTVLLFWEDIPSMDQE